MIDNLCERINEANCCAVKVASDYVYRKQKGRVTENDFYQLILMDQYLDVLNRYEKSLHLTEHNKCGCSHNEHSCINETQARFILEQITTICGSCSCCN